MHSAVSWQCRISLSTVLVDCALSDEGGWRVRCDVAFLLIRVEKVFNNLRIYVWVGVQVLYERSIFDDRDSTT